MIVAILLLVGSQSWLNDARGYVSRIDGSTQPYGIVIPAGYDPARFMRLDVVLHGSARPVGLSELRFMDWFDSGDRLAAAEAPPQVEYLELHPLGRVENGYRWAGETDVFEAIETVCRQYRVDRDRIVLRGMSMGASGTWHLGLTNPDRFVALGPYCGYVDTHRFSETPLPNFVRVGPLPAVQERTLHMLDSVDYAANAGIVPAVACMGAKDVFFEAHVIMGQALQREGLTMVNLISPGTGHTIDPQTHAEQMQRLAAHVALGLDHAPRQLRFVTWTLKYRVTSRSPNAPACRDRSTTHSPHRSCACEAPARRGTRRVRQTRSSNDPSHSAWPTKSGVSGRRRRMGPAMRADATAEASSMSAGPSGSSLMRAGAHGARSL